MNADLLATMGVIFGAMIVTVVKSAWNGRLNKTLRNRHNKQKVGNEAHEKILDSMDSIDETVHETKHRVEEIDDKVEDLNQAVVYLHREELEDDPLVRDNLDIDRNNDLLQD